MLRFLPALAALALFTTGCGYVGDPLPPLANVPAPITDLTAIQRSARIIVQFTLPTLTTEGIVIRSPLKIDLRAGSGKIEPFSAGAWEESAKPVPAAGPVENGHARLEVPTKDWTGQEVTLGVRVIGDNGKDSAWSNFVSLPVVPPPAAPASLAAQATAEGVRLTWQGGPGDYRIFRRAGKEPEFATVAEVQQDHWTDANSQFGTFYSYSVRRIVKLGNGREAESELSNTVTLTPADTFPPSAPASLRAIPAMGSIELSWERSPEADVAGYRVYRAIPGGSWERIAAVDLPGFSDRTVEKGKTYRYAVTAIDRSGNESPRSAETAATLPQ
jgi:hypothetical protein